MEILFFDKLLSWDTGFLKKKHPRKEQKALKESRDSVAFIVMVFLYMLNLVNFREMKIRIELFFMWSVYSLHESCSANISSTSALDHLYSCLK